MWSGKPPRRLASATESERAALLGFACFTFGALLLGALLGFSRLTFGTGPASPLAGLFVLRSGLGSRSGIAPDSALREELIFSAVLWAEARRGRETEAGGIMKRSSADGAGSQPVTGHRV